MDKRVDKRREGVGGRSKRAIDGDIVHCVFNNVSVDVRRHWGDNRTTGPKDRRGTRGKGRDKRTGYGLKDRRGIREQERDKRTG